MCIDGFMNVPVTRGLASPKFRAYRGWPPPDSSRRKTVARPQTERARVEVQGQVLHLTGGSPVGPSWRMESAEFRRIKRVRSVMVRRDRSQCQDHS